MSYRVLMAAVMLVSPLMFAGCGSAPPEAVALTADERLAAEMEMKEVEDAEREQQRQSQAGLKKKSK